MEQNAATNDAFDGVGLAGALDSFAEGKDNRNTDEKYEERKDEIVEMEPLPIDVVELVGEEIGGLAWTKAVQSVNEGVGADDPEHVEAAQSIDGHQALRLASGLRFAEFFGRGKRGTRLSYGIGVRRFKGKGWPFKAKRVDGKSNCGYLSLLSPRRSRQTSLSLLRA